MPRPDIGRKLVAFRLEPDLLAALDEHTADGSTRSDLIRAALRAYLSDGQAA